ncbi:MAG: hypothetical protein WCT50_04775 [Patescibacteria group bacterium]|jgi:hypothetical protein
MRNNYAPLLYIFIFILAVIGLSLLFLRQPVVDNLREQTGIAAVDVAVRKSPPANELIDTEILENDKLANLKNNVKVFVFEEICGKSVNTMKRCVQGNNNPFLKK